MPSPSPTLHKSEGALGSRYLIQYCGSLSEDDSQGTSRPHCCTGKTLVCDSLSLSLYLYIYIYIYISLSLSLSFCLSFPLFLSPYACVMVLFWILGGACSARYSRKLSFVVPSMTTFFTSHQPGADAPTEAEGHSALSSIQWKAEYHL